MNYFLSYTIQKRSPLSCFHKEKIAGWKLIKEILEIQQYWSPDEIREYASYKQKREQDERVDDHWSSVSSAIKQSRKEYTKTVKEVCGVDLEGDKSTSRPKKKSPKKNALAQKKSNGTGPKTIARNTRRGGIEY